MKFVGPGGEVITVPDPEAEPTQLVLLLVYNEIDAAIDMIECVYMATYGPDIRGNASDALRAVLDAAKARMTTAKDKLHPTIAWA